MKKPFGKRVTHAFIEFWATNRIVVIRLLDIIFYIALWSAAYGNGSLFIFDETTPAAVAIEREFTRLGGVLMAISLYNRFVK